MTERNLSIIDLLKCPRTGGELVLQGDRLVAVDDPSIFYPIKNNIIDFISYGSEYDSHWDEFSTLEPSKIKLDQGKEFIDWIESSEGINLQNFNLIIDVGCGDGNHLPFYPSNAIKLAVDYSSSVNIVRNRYSEMNNLYVIRADAANLPIKSSVADLVVSYGCINCMPSPKMGALECSRLLKKEGVLAIWGYGTNSIFISLGIKYTRGFYKILKLIRAQGALKYFLVPALYFLPSNSGISLKTNSLKECLEIISTNLSPANLLIFYKKSWKDLLPKNMVYMSEFKRSCGQLFRKSL